MNGTRSAFLRGSSPDLSSDDDVLRTEDLRDASVSQVDNCTVVSPYRRRQEGRSENGTQLSVIARREREQNEKVENVANSSYLYRFLLLF